MPSLLRTYDTTALTREGRPIVSTPFGLVSRCFNSKLRNCWRHGETGWSLPSGAGSGLPGARKWVLPLEFRNSRICKLGTERGRKAAPDILRGGRDLASEFYGSWTCKPNSVCGIAPAGRSFLWATHCCGAQATYPEVVTRRADTCLGRTRDSLPIWSCSVWGLPCPLHYCDGGALLPHLFTLTSALQPGRYVFCGTFRRPGLSSASRTLSGTLLCGVRTFLPSHDERPSGPAANKTIISDIRRQTFRRSLPVRISFFRPTFGFGSAAVNLDPIEALRYD